MNELDELRKQIDAIDKELAGLFLKRMAVTQKVGEYKLKNAIPVLDSGREREVLAAKAALAPDGASRLDLVRLYETIMSISRRQQRKLVREGLEDPGYARFAAAFHARRPAWTFSERAFAVRGWNSSRICSVP